MVVARSPHGQVGGVPGGGDGPAGRHLPRGDRARARPAAGPPAPRPSSWPCGSPGELGVIGLLAVELFETHGPAACWSTSSRCARTTPATGPSTGARTSQFEQHLRAVLDLPLGDPALTAPAAVMANVLGGDDADVYDSVHPRDGRATRPCKVHLYGKQVRPGRKIGHVTALGDDLAELGDRARRARRLPALGQGGRANEREPARRRRHGQRLGLAGDAGRGRGARRVRRRRTRRTWCPRTGCRTR